MDNDNNKCPKCGQELTESTEVEGAKFCYNCLLGDLFQGLWKSLDQSLFTGYQVTRGDWSSWSATDPEPKITAARWDAGLVQRIYSTTPPAPVVAPDDPSLAVFAEWFGKVSFE